MKSTGLKTMAAAVFVALAVSWAPAATVRELTSGEQAYFGATHEVGISFKDFATATTTNTAYTISNMNVAAKMGVELVAMILDTAFDTANTNFTGSCAVIVGDGTDDDLFLASTELASDGTEVFVKYGRPNTSAITASTVTYTNVIYGAGATTGNISTVTYTLADSVFAQKVYTAADKIDIKFTPNAEEAMGSNTVGEVRFLFRITDGR